MAKLRCISTPPRPPRQSGRNAPLIAVACAGCDEPHGEFAKKDLPKSFICGKCGLGQGVVATKPIGYSHKRNYPEGYFDQN
jgi:hypothetical protein